MYNEDSIIDYSKSISQEEQDRLLKFDMKKLEQENKEYKRKIDHIINLIDKGYNVSLERIKSILIDNNENNID